MRIAVVGAGPCGLAIARSLSEDPRHATALFEANAWFCGSVDDLFRLGVTLRPAAEVQHLAEQDAGVDLWVNGVPERFDLVLLTISPESAEALLARSATDLGEVRPRVYIIDLEEPADVAIDRIATDHPTVRCLKPVHAARRARASSHIELVNLSGHPWPLDAPAVYIANQRWILDLATLTDGAADELLTGRSLAVVMDDPHAREAAFAALEVNAAIVPLAAKGRPAGASPIRARRRRERVPVVIGEPFYPETSSIDELLDHMHKVVLYLERLANAHAHNVRWPSQV
jgi:hypothetical protein